MTEQMTEQLIDQRVLNRLPRLLTLFGNGGIPSPTTGGGILSYRLFRHYPPDRLWCLASSHSQRTVQEFVPGIEHQIVIPQIHLRSRLAPYIAQPINWLTVFLLVRIGIKFIQQKSIEALFTVPWGPFSVAAYYIHRSTRIPLYIYIMDDHGGGDQKNLLARTPIYDLLMPKLLRAATSIWTISSCMSENLSNRFQVASSPIYPFLEDVTAFQQIVDQHSQRQSDGDLRIIYTGAIYSAQSDALANLVQVLNNKTFASNVFPRPFSLTLYTSVSESALNRMTLSGSAVHRNDYVHVSTIPRVLAQADILFLPFSFDSASKHTVQTSFPAKTADYLASGVPILVHAPPYSSIAQYFREHHVGLVVDEPDQQKLADALVRLSTDTALREELSRNARNLAQEHHDSKRVLAQVFGRLAGSPVDGR
jgi:glycosyltransferase involved in cell wall biosynthesis